MKVRSFMRRELAVMMKRLQWEDVLEHSCERESTWYQASILDQGRPTPLLRRYTFELKLVCLWFTMRVF